MAVALRIDGGDDPTDIRSLDAWLSGRNELRGQVSRRTSAPEPGEMGSVTDVLEVALGPSGVAAALASVLISWIRRQKSTLSLRITCRCGREFALDADAVGRVTAETLGEEVARLETKLNCPCSAE